MARFLYLLLSVGFTVLGQVCFKMQSLRFGPMPNGLPAQFGFLLVQAFRPWALAGLFAGFLAVLCWMAALTRFPLSLAYPFTALAFILVPFLSHWLFGEPLTPLKLLGIVLIAGGIVLVGKG